MLVQVVGCSHHGTSIAVRERLAFTPKQTREALDQWRRVFPGVEAVLLSTCNRVEIYAATERETEPTLDQIANFLARFHDLDPAEVVGHLYPSQRRSGRRTPVHRGSASLDSMVLGEPQILAQVKDAYQTATQQDNTGPLLHAVFQAALRVARRVATSIPGVRQLGLRYPAIAAIGIVTVLAAGYFGWWSKPAQPYSQGQLRPEQLTAQSSEDPVMVTSVSPDGKYLLYADLTGLHLRPFASGETQTLPIPDTFCFR